MDDEARRIEKEVALPATPKDVWEAIATGPGISAWYVPHEIFPGEGGLVSLGPGLDGRVLVWEEGVRFAYGRFPRESPDQPDYLYDFRIAPADHATERDEATEGSTDTTDTSEKSDTDDVAELVAEVTDIAKAVAEEEGVEVEVVDVISDSVLTFVQSGFPDGEEWDAEFASYDQGWDLFLGNLVAYLTHFPGEPAATAVAGAESGPDAWARLLAGLKVEDVALNSEVDLTPDGPDQITGTVDVLDPGRLLGVRAENGLHRFAVEGDEQSTVSVYHYLYDEDVADEDDDVDQLTGDWQEWLDELFPPPDDEPSLDVPENEADEDSDEDTEPAADASDDADDESTDASEETAADDKPAH